MLTRKLPSLSRRRSAGLLNGALLLTVTTLSWATGADAPAALPPEPDYHLGITLQIDDGAAKNFALGGRADELMAADVDGVQIETRIAPTDKPGIVLLSLRISRDGEEIGRPALAMALGKEGRIEIGERNGDQFEGVRMDVSVDAWSERVNFAQADVSARAMAETIAAAAGLTLVGVEHLSDEPVSARFSDIPAATVMALLAETSGVRLRRVGSELHFEP